MNLPQTIPGTTTGSICPWCGFFYYEGGTHGPGICNAKRASVSETKYLGVTPDQVRQIIREELERFHAVRPLAGQFDNEKPTG